MRTQGMWRRPALGGWILLETMTVILVLTIIIGALADVWTTQVRTARIASEQLERERVRTAALLYAYGELTAGESSLAAVAERTRRRYPELTISAEGAVLTIDGSEFVWNGR
ncbi:MAG: hypothetical protein ACLFR8_09120 [Alkalispirochaeta sp.]